MPKGCVGQCLSDSLDLHGLASKVQFPGWWELDLVLQWQYSSVAKDYDRKFS